MTTLVTQTPGAEGTAGVHQDVKSDGTDNLSPDGTVATPVMTQNIQTSQPTVECSPCGVRVARASGGLSVGRSGGVVFGNFEGDFVCRVDCSGASWYLVWWMCLWGVAKVSVLWSGQQGG